MAELTSPASGATPGGSGANDGLPTPSSPAAAASAPIDPRAVRVRLAASSRTDSEPLVRMAPVSGPLVMTNPTVGLGPLGGVALAPHAEVTVGVLAQRQVLVNDEAVQVVLVPSGGGRYLLDEAGHCSRVILESAGAADGGAQVREVIVDGFRFLVESESERIAALRERASRGRASSSHSGPLQVKAIIPGKVVSVSVVPGDAVTAGQQLLVVEAMKMQNELRAPRDGTIDRVGVAVGVNIEIGDLLVVIS